MVAVDNKQKMLITKHDLDLALEENKALFHDDDVIDDDVYYELFLAGPEKKTGKDGRKRFVRHIDNDQRVTLCQELTTHILYQDKCFICGKMHCHKVSRSQILYKTFKKVDDYHLFSKASIPSSGKYYYPIISYMDLWVMQNSATRNIWGRKRLLPNYRSSIDTNRIYICRNCVAAFEEKARLEAQEILKLKGDEFWKWYNDEQNKDDWRRRLFVKDWPCGTLGSDSKAFYLRCTEGVHWESEEYKRYKKQKVQEELEIQQHRQLLEEAKRQQRIDEEKERERVRRSNELFLARKQKDSPTQRYINKFCLATSDVDVTNKTIIQEALNPANVEYEQIQKHNSTLYSEYLKSPLWHIISSKVKWNAGYKCEECGSTHNLHVHHISYEYKGIEFLNIGLLQCLCKDCHSKKHGK